MLQKIQRALISVSNKEGLIDIASFLVEKNIEIISTGGTLRYLQENKIRAKAIETFTSFPEILDGRVKTLHPKVHGALLSRKNNLKDEKELAENKIEEIDLLIVNLYPFAETLAKNSNQTEASFAEIIENIDIGGPSMLRSAAKNFEYKTVVCNPKDYELIQKEITQKGGIARDVRLLLATKVFQLTADYDATISSFLNTKNPNSLPEVLTLSFHRNQNLRYGENPHQKAAYYQSTLDHYKEKLSIEKNWEQIQGKELSYNNILDAEAAWNCIQSLKNESFVIVKHNNPCGVAMLGGQDSKASRQVDIFIKARDCDSVSAFGGIVACNRIIEGNTAECILEGFVELVLAPDFTEEAQALFSKKKNIRLIKIFKKNIEQVRLEARLALNGFLFQEKDDGVDIPTSWKCVTQKKLDTSLLPVLDFSWRVCKFVKSNAIVFSSSSQDLFFTLGIGAGQMSRLDSVEIAISKARRANHSLANSIVASDAFFPFRDGVDAIAKSGAGFIVQPGGSIRDAEVIEAADEKNIVMFFTGCRHFLH